MLAASWSRPVSLSVAALLAAVLAGCSGADAGGSPSPDGSVPPQQQLGNAATISEGRVSLLQKLGETGPLRTLNVEVDGRWECVDCAGDGVTSTGALTPEQLARLQTLLADPGLAKETDQARQYRVTCIDVLTSSLLTASGLITSQDCPGEEKPPIAHEILLLLTQATPADPTS
ncbi:hypothetical protein [Micromonospora thermarum]|uniref:DUF3558 domain-containing protein n=1 Tax=Micromonospora thermarum TaxID=2720024 RepID=A0ABX0Z169_9ACTN|nr:hypothetical protein [Micromonospora thermarum]NJP31517.1 hypothetical protein [Micromonospora thermarum]